MDIHLTPYEARVIGCLIEKQHTTPEHYPLSLNALTNACNQKSSRDPVVDYSTKLVDETLQLLRDAGWVRMIRASGNRTSARSSGGRCSEMRRAPALAMAEALLSPCQMSTPKRSTAVKRRSGHPVTAAGRARGPGDPTYPCYCVRGGVSIRKNTRIMRHTAKSTPRRTSR